MPDLYCIRCKNDIATAGLTAEEKQAVAAISRQQQPIFAVKYLLEYVGLAHRQAKTIGMHLTRQPHHCVRCDNQMLEAGESICPKCQSVNLDW